MDLSVLENEKLPKQVMAFLKEEIGFYTGELVVSQHDVEPYISNPEIFEHRLYLQLCNDSRAVRLFVVKWTYKDGNCYPPAMDEMFVSDFELFRQLIPA